MKVQCPNPNCAQTVDLPEHADCCPWCLTEIKKPLHFTRKNFIQYHKTDQHGPPGRNLRSFRVSTNKPVDNLHGHTLWLISGEGRPKEYFLECYFQVNRVGDYPEGEAPFAHFAEGKEGFHFRPPLPLNNYAWFKSLRKSLMDFQAGLTEISRTVADELHKLVKDRKRDMEKKAAKKKAPR
jgi:hypothetical protein